MSFGFEVKKQFFDRQVVTQRAQPGKRKALSKIGAFVRQSAKGSIRKRKKPAREGQPPSSHTGLLKKFIYFAYEPLQDSVVVGPTRLGSKEGIAPSLLEEGGTATRNIKRKRGGTRQERVTYKPRPYMRPALERERKNGKLQEAWKDVIK